MNDRTITREKLFLKTQEKIENFRKASLATSCSLHTKKNAKQIIYIVMMDRVVLHILIRTIVHVEF